MKKIFSIWILPFFCICYFSCNQNAPGGIFLDDYVYFKYPKGWYISDVENISESEHEVDIITIQKQGWVESGMVIVSVYNWNNDLNEMLNGLITEYEDGFGMINFEDKYYKIFKGYNAIYIETTASLLGIKHKIEIYAFHAKNKSILFFKQEAIEDMNKNVEGFSIIENTLKIK